MPASRVYKYPGYKEPSYLQTDKTNRSSHPWIGAVDVLYLMMMRPGLRYLSVITVLSSNLLTSDAVRFKCGDKKLSGPLSVGSYKDYLSEICPDLSVTTRER